MAAEPLERRFDRIEERLTRIETDYAGTKKLLWLVITLVLSGMGVNIYALV